MKISTFAVAVGLGTSIPHCRRSRRKLSQSSKAQSVSIRWLELMLEPCIERGAWHKSRRASVGYGSAEG